MESAPAFNPKEVVSTESLIHVIDSKQAFNALDDKEKNYAYHMAQASWQGAKICWFQRSYESPALFVLLKLLFAEGSESLKAKSLANGVTEDQWKKMLAYSAAVFNNCGNFKSFGDTKFVPEIDKSTFEKIVQASASYASNKEQIDTIWEKISFEVYCEQDPLAKVGFHDENGGQSSYYSSNVTQAEAKMIDEWCQEVKVSPLNTRLIKTKENEFEMRVCSSVGDSTVTPYLKTYQKDGKTLKITAADFKDFMDQCGDHIGKSVEFSRDDNQKQMLEAYVEHFKYGDVDKHKESQKYWIKDVGPIVETDIGFIETYLDPLGARAEFEGFVAVVDKVVSKKFNTLVDRAEEFIEFLPWGKDYEKDKFSKPDFTNLDIIAFACSGTPIGINIPNYDDIRMNVGFKNVNLSNVYPKRTAKNVQFLKDSDVEHMVKFSNDALLLIVALHELLGHGTGKLLTKNVDTGEINYSPDLKHPYNGGEITTAYLSTETWGQKFGKMHSGYEECRADSVALYLMHYDGPYEIFFSDKKEQWDDIHYCGWLDMLWGGVKGLIYFNTEQKQWMQAHVEASWVIFQAIRQGDPSIITFEFTQKDGKDWFIMHIDRDKLRTTGHQALSEFLGKLHILKSLGDYESAEKFFHHYTEVDDEMLKIRDIVMANKLPRRLELQPNLFKESDGSIIYKDYEESFEGIIQSYCERYEGDFQKDVYAEWVKDVDHFRYPLASKQA